MKRFAVRASIEDFTTDAGQSGPAISRARARRAPQGTAMFYIDPLGWTIGCLEYVT